MNKGILLLAALGCVLFAAQIIPAQARHRIRFARGASEAVVTGTVRGYAYRDYLIGASAGQSVRIKLRSANTYSVFTVFMPGGDNLNGAAELDEFSGELPVSGDYVIRVGMMRAGARRRGSAANFSLTVSIR